MYLIIVKHTSASIALCESYDSSVLTDMETIMNRIVPEGSGLYAHSMEGPDDMPAHAKNTLIGSTHTIPITDGKLNMGTWQGVWLCEHRDSSSSRHLVITLNGLAK